MINNIKYSKIEIYISKIIFNCIRKELFESRSSRKYHLNIS